MPSKTTLNETVGRLESELHYAIKLLASAGLYIRERVPGSADSVVIKEITYFINRNTGGNK